MVEKSRATGLGFPDSLMSIFGFNHVIEFKVNSNKCSDITDDIDNDFD